MKYDILLKDLIGKVPSVFARNILGVDVTEDITPIQVDLSASHHRKPDLIFVTERFLVHVELQTKNDKNIVLRQLEYRALIEKFISEKLKKDLDVLQIVIYCGEDSLKMLNSLNKSYLLSLKTSNRRWKICLYL